MSTNVKRFLVGILGGALLTSLVLLVVEMQAQPVVTVYKSETCGCCNDWVDHLKEAGFEVTAMNRDDMNSVKSQLGVPVQLASCHTAVVGKYVVEGHVPAASIRRLLDEEANIRGLAVPGMPTGSPGMEVPGRPADRYDVIAFSTEGTAVFDRY